MSKDYESFRSYAMEQRIIQHEEKLNEQKQEMEQEYDEELHEKAIREMNKMVYCSILKRYVPVSETPSTPITNRPHLNMVTPSP